MTEKQPKKRRWFRWVMGVILLPVVLVVLLIILLQMPSVQTRVAQKVVQQLESRVGVEMSVEKLGIRFPKALWIEGVYVEDARGDTLMVVNSIEVDMRMVALLRNKIHVHRLQIDGLQINVLRDDEETGYRHDIILQAFAGEERVDEDAGDQAEWQLTLGILDLKDVQLVYGDAVDSIRASLIFDRLTLQPNNIDLSTLEAGPVKMVLGNAGMHYSQGQSMHMETRLERLEIIARYLMPGVARFNLELFQADGLDAEITIAQQLDAEGRPPSPEPLIWADMMPVDLIISRLEVNGSAFRMPGSPGKPSYLEWEGLDLWFNELVVNADTLGVKMEKVVGKEASGLEVVLSIGRLALGEGFEIQQFDLKTRDSHLSTSLTTSHHLDDLSDFLNPEHTLVLELFQGHLGSDFFAFLPMEDFGNPWSLNFDAALHGTLGDLSLNALLWTPSVELDLAWDMETDSMGDIRWLANLTVEGEDPLALVGLEEAVTGLKANFKAEGRGFDPATMHLALHGQIESIKWNSYAYEWLDITASISDGLMENHLWYEDENLVLDVFNRLHLNQDYPRLEAVWDLKHLNTQALNLTPNLVALQTSLRADVLLDHEDFFTGYIAISETHVLVDSQVHSLDSVLLETWVDQESYLARVMSDVLQLDYVGNISPLGIPNILSNHMNLYLEAEDHSHADNGFFPQFTMDASTDSLDLAGWKLRQLNIRARSNPEAMEFTLTLPVLEGDMLHLNQIHLESTLRDGHLDFALSFEDQNEQPWLDVGGNLHWLEDSLELVLDHDLIFNRQQWAMNPENLLVFSRGGLYAEHWMLTVMEKEISMQGNGQMGPDLTLSLRNLDLGSFDLVGGKPLVEGLLSGNVVVNNLEGSPLFGADLEIGRLVFQDQVIGDLSVHMLNPDPGVYSGTVVVANYGNRLNMEGMYNAGDDLLEAELRLDRLEFAALEGITTGQLSNLDGLVSGSVRLFGSASSPEFDGQISFEQVGLHVDFLNVDYRISQETIVFDSSGVIFDSFSMMDPSGNVMELHGRVDITSLDDPRFDLRLTANNFLALNASAGDNPLFYGRLLLDTDLGLKGPLQAPVAEGRLKLNQGSDFHFFLPQSQPQAIGDEGVVLFVNPSDTLFAQLRNDAPARDFMISAFTNLDLAVNVEIDPQTRIRIVLDEMAGDALEIRGGGVLSYGVEPGGRMTLAGRYEISQGAYQMTFYDVFPRNFRIQQGSHLVWSGDPLDATVNITAIYDVRTSARELMVSHALTGGQPETAYRQQYPFEVYLKMQGDLLNPQIAFEIGLPVEHRGALEGRLQARINELNQNESELNKQVFALLILGSFIQDDPLSSFGSGPGLSSTARSSASRILTQQMNRLSDRYIRGVDLSFDVESYEEIANGRPEGRTTLQVEISRDFFDQRLRVTAGGQVNLEDESGRQVQPTDIAGDFSVEYLLTADGRYILKGFRQKNYQDVFEGEVTETGVSLIFRKTYQRFRDLFIRKKEEENQ